jgi:glycosyltransferase involved in cell wall biosynthesis|tara:strand:+ start:20 stop:1354 length:1335 start_codon:yes stop_codon:yes gene_type:complete
MTKEELQEVIQFKDEEDRDKIKQYFTQPEDLDLNKKTIVFSTPSETGTSFFRVFEPLRSLWKAFPDEANYVYTENLQPNHVKIADVIIMHRCGNLHSHFLSVTRMWPKTEKRPYIIHDADDNEFNLPNTHPMKTLWMESGKDKMSLQSIKHSDCITTTTPKLKDTFEKFNDDVSIFPNMFDWELPQWCYNKNEIRKEILPDWFPTDDKIIIGWAGLTSHFEDIKRMAPIMKAIHDKYPNTYFVIAGMALKDTQVEIHEDEDGNKTFEEKEISNKEETYKGRIEALYKDIDPKRLKILNALPLETYAKFYALFDISLAYIEHNAFASCKSEIKVVEALHYGCIPVFSNYGGYKTMCDKWPSSFSSKHFAIDMTSAGAWVNAISHHIDNYEESKKRTAELTEWSDRTYDINAFAEERLNFYTKRSEEFQEDWYNNNIAQYLDYEGA